MAKKQLDFNAPLLSVRRFSSPTRSFEGASKNSMGKSTPNRQISLPVCKSDFELGEVTKPAAVPFHWEKIPGRPKGEGEGPIHPPEEPSNTPRLPPGRVSGVIRYNSGESPKLLSGRLSGFSRYNSGERSNDPNINRTQIETFPFNDHASLIEKLHESLNSRGDSDIESGDDAYSEALDKLSLTESWSLNYSVSGLSGYQGSGIKPSGTFSIDVQTKDFMMNRFLPAAKAVVLETPQYVVKKQTTVIEQPKPVKKVVSGERKTLFEQYGSNIMSRYIQYMENVESEYDDPKCTVPVKKSGKIWGILPRFCVKNSLCLLNPLPGMKSKIHAPMSPAGDVRRLTRNGHSGPIDKNVYHAIYKKKYHSGVLSRDMLDIGNKLRSDSNQFSYCSDSFKPGVPSLRQCRSGPISPYRNEAPKSPFHEGAGFLGVPKEIENHKHNGHKIASSRKMCKPTQDVSRNQIHKQGSVSPGVAVEKTLYVDGPTNRDSSKDEKIVDFPCENLKSMDECRQTEAVKSYDQDKSSPNVSEGGKSLIPKLRKSHPVSPYQNEASKSYVHGRSANKIASSRKLCKALQDVSRNHMQRKVLCSPGDAVEKTLYMNAVTKTADKSDKIFDFSDKNLKSSNDSRRTEENVPVKSSDIDTSSLDISTEGKSRSPKLSGSTDMVLPNQSFDQECRLVDYSKVHSDANSSVNNKENIEQDNQRDADSPSLKSPLPPPLPKSPSESWLWRTLPSISLPNPFSHSSQYHPKKQAQKAIANDNTWETIVKTSNSRHDDVRCSEELIPRVTHLLNKT
ncbi:uncharacterized protein LOC111370530 [Olea europaea var. sylvestris]|uniref:Uncharacterized protein n=1 Tax=Olea europaea subsp. europaea TaxID=158383 RepID=A0A8S0PCF4_OLEEU|nr:uncharacterized protein LOC111370530 [Olea europaea var. sylvestris]XP_022848024.1 uncharacterized protein LOC111370530 [Olea europaea var. sylvestris]XP_022848025.1 uncharacterized protein LOC111370530 [Olea europaea var. sylvestris]CAA2937389.1 Hypothetical predicted protein [Olea europaea subsp. europaea]